MCWVHKTYAVALRIAASDRPPATSVATPSVDYSQAWAAGRRDSIGLLPSRDAHPRCATRRPATGGKATRACSSRRLLVPVSPSGGLPPGLDQAEDAIRRPAAGARLSSARSWMLQCGILPETSPTTRPSAANLQAPKARYWRRAGLQTAQRCVLLLLSPGVICGVLAGSPASREGAIRRAGCDRVYGGERGRHRSAERDVPTSQGAWHPICVTPSSPDADAGDRRWRSCQHHGKSITPCQRSSGWSTIARPRRSCFALRALGKPTRSVASTRRLEACPVELRLADAQRAIAREHGHSSWAAFRRDIERQANEPERPVARIGPASSESFEEGAAALLRELAGGNPGSRRRLRAHVPRLAALATPRSASGLRSPTQDWSSPASTVFPPGEGLLRAARGIGGMGACTRASGAGGSGAGRDPRWGRSSARARARLRSRIGACRGGRRRLAARRGRRARRVRGVAASRARR